MDDAPKTAKFLGILETLLLHRVEFAVVGDVVAQLAGAPTGTLKLEILYPPSPENVVALFAALHELRARYRSPAGRDFEPDLEKLATKRTHLLMTDLGALDALSAIGYGLTYGDLVDRMRPYDLRNLEVRVLDLAAVIESKEHANRDKDRAALPVLRQTLG
ncbi:MAG TPA: hypothetical protein VGE98_14455 [Thermoanaerobaculia bacterium]